MATQADTDRHAVAMEVALAGCSERGDRLVGIIDGTQEKPKRKLFGLF